MAPLSRHETRGSESTVPERPDPEEDLLAARPRRRRRLSMGPPPSCQDLADLRAGSVNARSNERFPSVAEWLPSPATRPEVLSPPSRSDRTRRRTCWPLDRAHDDGGGGA
ncbi:unnamed protein product [Boreogadus saida]